MYIAHIMIMSIHVERIIVVRISMAVPVMEVTADEWIKEVFQ